MLATALALALATNPSVQLAALAGRYRDYDLPLPPADAKLYRLTTHRPDNPPEHREWVNVGFVLAVSPHGKPEKVLIGLNEERWFVGEDYSEAELTAKTWNGLSSRGRWSEWLLAVQCEASGRHELALAAWDAWRAGGAKLDPSSELAKMGWKWWLEQFQSRDADRAKLARRLQLIATDHPTAGDADLLRSLKLSLTPSDAKSGSVDALIDELLDVSVYPAFLDEEPDRRLTAIRRLGFDAVPALIRHLDDDRLTRCHAVQGIGWGIRPSYPYSVKHFARDILLGYMCQHVDDEIPVGDKALTAEDVDEWWKEAKEEGEEVYFVRQLTQHCGNRNLLAVVGAKYPKQLPEVFTTVTKEDPLWFNRQPLVDTLVRSSLTTAEKSKVLLEASESTYTEWQAVALEGLHRIAPDVFHKRLIAVLKDLPTEANRAKERELIPAYYTCIANVATLTDDVKVWAAVGKYLESASPEVKVEWVYHLTRYTEAKDKCFRQVVGCVAGLLTDESVRLRVNGDKVSVLPLRNYTAEQLGQMLFVKTTPSEQWSDDDWKAFRDEVAKAAKDAIKSKR